MAGTDGAFIISGDGFLIAKYALMGAAGVGQEDGDDKWSISGLLLSVLGFRNFNTGYRMLDTGFWILDPGSWILDPGRWMLVPAC